MTAVIGFVGLGVMGREMALNLARGGFRVLAHDLRAEALAGLEHDNLRPVDSLGVAAADADILITMLPDTPQVEAVLVGPGGLLEHPPRGRLLVDMSTIAPSATRVMSGRLAERGITLLDAPVSGGVKGAHEASLSIMVGGPEAAFETVRPVLAAMGKTIVHVGAIGAGQSVKACNQIMVAMHIQAMCEAFALGRALELDLAKLRDVLLGGAASSWMLQNLGPLVLAQDDRAGFRIDLMLKDLRLAAEEAFALGVPLPGAALATNLYLDARAHGEGANGNQALFRVYDRLTDQAT